MNAAQEPLFHSVIDGRNATACMFVTKRSIHCSVFKSCQAECPKNCILLSAEQTGGGGENNGGLKDVLKNNNLGAGTNGGRWKI